MPIATDGQNLAFLFNTSVSDAKTSYLDCFLSQLIELVIKATHQVIKEEEANYFQTLASEDSYVPSIYRKDDIFESLRVTRRIQLVDTDDDSRTCFHRKCGMSSKRAILAYSGTSKLWSFKHTETRRCSTSAFGTWLKVSPSSMTSSRTLRVDCVGVSSTLRLSR